MCKTAYCILIERAAKYAYSQDRRLRVFFEESGEKEDRDVIAYTKAMKSEGMPFDPDTSSGYSSLSAKEIREIVLGDPRRRTKKVPMMQISDLVLYPMAKGGYDRGYGPYASLVEGKKLIDAHIKPCDRPTLGIKYSCFDTQTTKART